VNRLSSNHEEMGAEYDVVVVGSGYGGSIAAARLSRAEPRPSVCVLERGRELRPGEYPATQAELLQECQVDLPREHTGSPAALFDLRVGDDLDVLVGCGLGGTSLIDAGTCLRAKDEVFDDPVWPIELRENPRALDRYYALAEDMLRPVPYPHERSPGKLRAQRSAATALGAELERPPLCVSFESVVNRAGIEQAACNDCGDCLSGCNRGAKNTVLMNYLPDAHRHGAEIYTEVSVAWIEPCEDGRWLVRFAPTAAGKAGLERPGRSVLARTVVLAAGTLGTTEILLRSRQKGLATSPLLGRRVSHNGDAIAFTYNAACAVNGIGFGAADPTRREPVGPCTTSSIDLRSGPLEGQRTLQDGAIPGPLADVVTRVLARAAGPSAEGGPERTPERGRSGAARIAESLVRGAYRGALQHTQAHLVTGHDDARGRLELEGERVRLRWPGASERSTALDRVLALAAEALGGTSVPNPVWHESLEHERLTFQPLGGCPMAPDASRGVVDHAGRVYAGAAGTRVHEGLWIMDGSIVPRSLGVGPLLTISALAERSSALLVEGLGGRIDYGSEPEHAVVPRPVAGIRFRESLRGWISTDELEDYERAAALGERAGAALRLELTIVGDDLGALLEDPRHAARLSGSVLAPALSPRPLEVRGGSYRIGHDGPDDPGVRRVDYRLELESVAGRSYALEGRKLMRDEPGHDRWREASTVYVTLESEGERVARGILATTAADFARQMEALRVTGERDEERRLQWQARIGHALAGGLFDVYGSVFAMPTVLGPARPPRRRRALRTGPPETRELRARDGGWIRLTRYRGGPKGPVVLVHDLGLSSRMFRSDTIDTNLLEYLYGHGYDVWLLDLRVSHELPASPMGANADEVAGLDFSVAVEAIRAMTGASDLQFVAHGFGSMTLFMAMLAGLRGVRSVVASQVATHPVVAADALERVQLAGQEGLEGRLQEQLPDEVQEGCSSASCHRATHLYGPLFEHLQLSRATHETLHELFGLADTRTLAHLATIVRCGQVVRSDGSDAYLPHVGRLAVPTLFLHGGENAVYPPEGTRRSFVQLSRSNGAGLYGRHVLPDYGHLDCILGQHAVRDVYPLMLAHLERTAIGACLETAGG